MSLEKIKSTLKAGARPNKYAIVLDNIAGGPSAETMNILCKATSLPEATIGVIDIFNQGRKLPIAGDKAYSNTWDVTFYNTRELAIRDAMNAWMELIDNAHSHYRAKQENSEYMRTLYVTQLDGQNKPTAEYTIFNAWPSSISAVDLADESNDTVSEFTVTFTFSDWTKKGAAGE